MRTFDTQGLSSAFDARRRGLKGLGKTGALSSPQIDEACSLFVAAERIRECGKSRITERRIEDILEDYFRKAKAGDHSAEAVVDTVTTFMEAA